MVTYTRPEIDWDTFPGSDGEPMAETVENAIQMVDLQFALRCLLETQSRVRVAVGGNQRQARPRPYPRQPPPPPRQGQ